MRSIKRLLVAVTVSLCCSPGVAAAQTNNPLPNLAPITLPSLPDFLGSLGLPVDNAAPTLFKFNPAPVFNSPQQLLLGNPIASVGNRDTGYNYQWVNDVWSQALAGTSGPVLHRVPGSFFNSPDVPSRAVATLQETGKVEVGPSTPVFINQELCTLLVAGTDASGRKVGVTAGHCGKVGDVVESADLYEAGVIGKVAYVNSNLDYLIIEFNDKALPVADYGTGKVDVVGGTFTKQDELCKTGVATNLTCGKSIATGKDINVNTVCAMQGDSGAPITVGDRLVAMVAGGAQEGLACTSPLQGFLYVPTAAILVDRIFVDIESRGELGAGFVVPGKQVSITGR